ncbi:MAG: choice-of-anchor tandem repeat NxxGxxAF-containing protein [Planctomycetota bacterium]
MIHMALLGTALALAVTDADRTEAQSPPTIQRIAFTGEEAPGTGTFVRYNEFFIGPINDAAETVFVAGLVGPGISAGNDSGLWSSVGGSALSLVAREGQQTPVLAPGINFAGAFFSRNINESGAVTFEAPLEGAGINSNNDRSIWFGSSATDLRLVARSGDTAPGTTDGAVFASGIGDPVANDLGEVAFSGIVAGVSVTDMNDQGVWSETGGTGLRLIAREHQQAPGLDPGVLFDFAGSTALPLVNNAGDLVFVSGLRGAGVTTANDSGIWQEEAGTGLSLLVREGDTAPGTNPPVQFAGFSNIAITEEGRMVFLATVAGAGVSPENDTGFWAIDPLGSISILAREGDHAPGLDSTIRFGFFAEGPVINASGDIAFLSYLVGSGVDSSNNQGIWAQDALGSFELIARAGEQASEVEPGVVYSSFGPPAFNTRRQIAFSAQLSGGAQPSQGLWLMNECRELSLLAQVGEAFDVDDSPTCIDLRVVIPGSIGYVGRSGGQGGRASSLNDNGEFAFSLIFTDGSAGIFLASVSQLVGDVNGDGFTTPADFTAWIIAYNSNAPECDQNGDEACTPADFNAWVLNFNSECP